MYIFEPQGGTLTTYQQNEDRLSRQFFGQSGKSVAVMEEEFRHLSTMHDRNAQDIERDRAAATTIIADMLAVAKDSRCSGPMRAAFLHAAVILVIAYQESFPGAVSGLRSDRRERPSGGGLNLSKGQMSVLTSARAGLVSFVRTVDGIRFSRAGRDVTDDASALFGVELIAVSDALEGEVAVTERGLQELR